MGKTASGVPLARYFGLYWPPACLGIATVVSICWQIRLGKETSFNWYELMALLLISGLFLLGTFGSYSKSRTIFNLESKLESSGRRLREAEKQIQDDRANFLRLFEDYLSLLANDLLNLGNTERISVQKHDGNAFLMIGRYSRDLTIRVFGRYYYPDNQGCIKEAWANAMCIIDDLPDPQQEIEEYVNKCVTMWNIEEAVVRSLSMKSRSLAAIAVENFARNRRIGIVVVESIKAS